MNINGSQPYANAVKVIFDQQQRWKDKTMMKQKRMQDEPPELRQMREIMRQNKKSMEYQENDQIAKKIARGEAITEAEREQLRAKDPEKLRKAEEANIKRATISKKLARAKTKAEAAVIIASEKSTAVAIFEKGDTELGELYLEAVFKAESDYYQKKKVKTTVLKDTIHFKQKQTFDFRR